MKYGSIVEFVVMFKNKFVQLSHMPSFSPAQNKVNHVKLFFKKDMLLSNV